LLIKSRGRNKTRRITRKTKAKRNKKSENHVWTCLEMPMTANCCAGTGNNRKKMKISAVAAAA
jgi:hypothetical protein